MTSSTLENGVVEEFGYDAARMQMISQTASKTTGGGQGVPPPPPPVTTTYLDVDYDYEAAAGEMGASTTAGNAGQLMGISGTIDSQSESAAFTYDNVGRLKTSTQTTNSVTAKRQFDYDRWGNRTAVWDTDHKTPVQLQSVSLVESSSIPNNQIESVTENSATSDYTYDAAGNVTDDDVNTFVYDAENRLVSINSGAEQYKYDHQNRRIEKIVGSVGTHYVWEGSQVIAEHAASTGNVLVDYVFAGGRMTKKVEGATTRYFLSDRLSMRLTLSPAAQITGEVSVMGKQSHLPFGEAMATSGEQDKHRFTSYEREASTGLDYAVNRWHSSGVGRFLQVDPIAGNGAIPQRLNRYSYTRNDPINRTDQLGLQDTPPCPVPGCTNPNFHLHGDAPWPDDETWEPNGETVITQPVAFVIELPSPTEGENEGGAEPCSAVLPTNPDELAIVYTIMHEHTPLGFIGKNQYAPGDRRGNRTGKQVINESAMWVEALAFASAIRNYADATNQTVEQSVRKDMRYIISYRIDKKTGKRILVTPEEHYANGARIARDYLSSPEGSPQCEQLKRAINAAIVSVYVRILSPEYKWWKAVYQGGRYTRRQGPGDIRIADTDFATYPGAPPGN